MSSINSLGYSYSAYSNYSNQNSGTRQSRPSEDEIATMQEERFSQIDTDGDGSVNASEFEEMFNQMSENMPELPTDAEVTAPTAEELFSEFDADSDGSISLDEFTSAEESMRSERRGPPPPPPGGGMMSSSDESETSTTTEELLQQLLGADSEDEDTMTVSSAKIKSLISMLAGQSAYATQALTSSSLY